MLTLWQNNKKLPLIIFLMSGGIFILAILIEAIRLAVLENVEPTYAQQRTMYTKTRLRATRSAAEAFALKSSAHFFPDNLDSEFRGEISRAAAAEQINDDPPSHWLVIKKIPNASTGIAQVDKSAHDHVFYCPIEENNHAVGYCIFAVNSNGNLICGPDGKPLFCRDSHSLNQP